MTVSNGSWQWACVRVVDRQELLQQCEQVQPLLLQLKADIEKTREDAKKDQVIADVSNSL